MAYLQWKATASLVLMVMAAFSLEALGQTRSQVYGSDLDRQTMTASLQGDVGVMTYDSKTVRGEETAQLTTWTFSTFSGEARKLGMSLRSSKSDVAFELNHSRLMANFTDLRIHTRLGWFYPSIAGSLTELNVWRNNEEFVDIYSSSLGAGLGLFIPLWDRAVIYADHVVFNPTKVMERTGRDAKLGQRADSEIGASFDITDRVLDFVFGYRRRTYSLTVNEEKTDEMQLGAFVGLRMGFYF